MIETKKGGRFSANNSEKILRKKSRNLTNANKTLGMEIIAKLKNYLRTKKRKNLNSICGKIRRDDENN